MRILYVIGDLSIGGAEVFTRNVSVALSRLGATVEIACYYDDRFLADGLDESGVVVHSLGERRFGLIATAVKIKRLVKARGIDVVHAHSFAAALRVACARVMGTRAATAITFHNLGYDAYLPTLSKKIRRFLEGMMTRWCFDHWLAVSAAAADSYRRHLRRPLVEVIPNGIDLGFIDATRRDQVRSARVRYGVPQDAPLIVLPGRLVWEKGHRVLLDALPGILAAHPDAFTIMVGDGPLLDELQKYAAALGVDGRVIIVPGLAQDKLFALIRSADLVTIPSLAEGYGLLVAETMGLGVPMVCSGVDAIREVLGEGENAVVVPAGDDAALAAAVVELLRDKDRQAILARNGRRRAEHELSIDVVAGRHLESYERLLTARAGSKRAPSAGRGWPEAG